MKTPSGEIIFPNYIDSHNISDLALAADAEDGFRLYFFGYRHQAETCYPKVAFIQELTLSLVSLNFFDHVFGQSIKISPRGDFFKSQGDILSFLWLKCFGNCTQKTPLVTLFYHNETMRCAPAFRWPYLPSWHPRGLLSEFPWLLIASEDFWY